MQQQDMSTIPFLIHSRLQLLNMPNEVLASIINCLHSPAPSVVKSLSKPEHDLTFSSHQPLKSLSVACKSLRSLVLPLLFRHARLDPYHLTTFLNFVTRSDVARHIVTVTARLQGPCNHIHPPWWLRLLNKLSNLNLLVIFGAPHVFAEIGKVPIETGHSWAFKIPYHTVTLGGSPSFTAASSAQECSTDPGGGPSLLTVKPWTTLSINESSHLPAYSTYEYFLKTPPSLLTSLNHWNRIQSPPVDEPITNFFSHLNSFSYTAIFPFYNHIDEILKCVRQMKNLKRLFMKLCPEPESTVLQDEMERNGSNAGRTEGRIDVNDPWNEFETSYTLIPHTIIYLTTEGSLEWFKTDDTKMIGVKDKLIEDIDKRLNGLGCWSYTDNGVWVRDKSVKIWSPSQT